MANEEHVEILREGVEVWNRWRNDEPDVKPDLSRARLFRTNLNRANLSKANLSEANLIRANLSGANLSEANLIGTDFSEAWLISADLVTVNLISANLSDANLSCANLSRANLSGANCSNANLLSATLSKAVLSFANLTKAVLNQSNFCGADLSRADLSRVQVLDAKFNEATLTGVCVEDWHINSRTNLESVICDYIYLDVDENGEFTKRRPSNGIFAPGDFAKLVQKEVNTVDFTFRNGIDWLAFAQSSQKFQGQAGAENLDIRSMENKEDGAFVIRVNVPSNMDKRAIQQIVMEEYDVQVRKIEAEYRAHLQNPEDQIIQYRQENTDLWEVAKLMASRSINVEAKAEALAENEPSKYDLRDAKFAGGFAETVQGDQVGGTQHNYASPEKQDLAETAAAIQRLLKQLEETNPSATEAEQTAFVSAAIPPTLKQRAVGALQAGGQTALEEFLDNPYVNVALSIVEGWREP